VKAEDDYKWMRFDINGIRLSLRQQQKGRLYSLFKKKHQIVLILPLPEALQS